MGIYKLVQNLLKKVEFIITIWYNRYIENKYKINEIIYGGNWDDRIQKMGNNTKR